jgi:hypothetical protein
MSLQIDNSFVRQYERDVHDVFQMNGSVLKPGVRMKTDIVGESTTFQKAGKGVATTKARHGQITPMNQDHTAIVCTLADFYAGDWVDRLDEAKINIDERGVIARGGAMALGRKVDDQIFTALDTTSQSTVTITVTSAATIRNSFTSAISALIANDAYEPGMLYGVLSPAAWEMLMTVEQFQNADFVGPDGQEFKKNVPVKGAFKSWLGVLWTVHSANPGVGTATSKMFVWHKEAIGYATGKHAANLAGTMGKETAIGADITWHGDRAAHFVNHAMSGGACLIDDTGVIEMNMDDTATVPTS